MNIDNLLRIKSISNAIKFKEYLLNRDVSSRRIIIDHCISLTENHPAIVGWFHNLRAINDQLDSKDRKEQIKADACWDELILTLTSNDNFNAIMSWFISSG